MYVRKVKCGNFAICDPDVEGTPYEEWVSISDRHIYTVKAEGELRRVLFCQVNDSSIHVPEIEMIYGRCEASMRFLDPIHREYINTMELKKDDVLAIKSVAGSGKTTTLIRLAEAHKDKRILYLAFNKSIVEEIKQKAPPNLFPCTFDSLLYKVLNHRTIKIIDLNIDTVCKIVPWFNGKSKYVRRKYVELFDQFCNQTIHQRPETFTGEKPEKLLNSMWDDVLKGRFQTYNTIRKLCHDRGMCRGILDENYDMIFVDESQDFDLLMLSILFRDTTIPKVFVGDPLQAIYQFRGAIDAFERLPKHTKVVEFYKSFRIGEPVCTNIRKQFDCFMISGTDHETKFVTGNTTPSTKYVYLFREWKNLINTALEMENVWINGFDNTFARLKNIVRNINYSSEKLPVEIPRFFSEYEREELVELLDVLEANMVPRDKCTCEMYTIHAYKGLEDDVVKIYNDIQEEEANLRYVALTRGRREINVCTE